MSTLRELVAKWREYGERSIMQEAYTALGEARGYRNCATELEAVAEEGSNNNAKEELDAIDELCGPRQPDDATSVFCRISHKLRAAAPSLHKEGLPPLAETFKNRFDPEWTPELEQQLLEKIAERAALHKEGAGGAPAERLREALEAIQWGGCDGLVPVCPKCFGDQEQGHAEDCIVGRALAASPAGRAEQGVKGFAGDPRDSK